MFLYPGFESRNAKADVPPGLYHGVCTVYVDRKTGAMALLSEYTLERASAPGIAELQLVDRDGQAVRFLDFIRMPDRSWRDSYGLRAQSLGGLLPGFIARYRFFESVETGAQAVGVAHG
jgi:hypothetical protein